MLNRGLFLAWFEFHHLEKMITVFKIELLGNWELYFSDNRIPYQPKNWRIKFKKVQISYAPQKYFGSTSHKIMVTYVLKTKKKLKIQVYINLFT